MQREKSFDLTGKVALITGGSEGIGKAISLGLATSGAKVIVNYLSGEDKAIETRNEIEKNEGTCFLFECDISLPEVADKFKAFLTEHKLEVDILVLNASVQFRKPWEEVGLEEFSTQVNTNLRSSLLLIQALYPGMEKKGWGRILTIGSIQQVRPHPQMIVYSATKSAQVNLVKNLATQLAPNGVTINNLAPGAISTRRNQEVLKDENYKKIVEAKIPLGFVGNPEDCVPMALLLCSDAGRYITGQDIFVDGGMSLLP
jgi:glucose 1-dehydrogenase